VADTQDHTIKSNWREADVAAKAERVLALMAWLDHTTDLVEMLAEDDKKLTGELRGVAGGIRKKRDDISSEVEALKAELADRANS
jgi:hypothetical protein